MGSRGCRRPKGLRCVFCGTENMSGKLAMTSFPPQRDVANVYAPSPSGAMECGFTGLG